MAEKKLILSHQQIEKKIKRLALQLLERHFTDERIVMAGLNERGTLLAQLLEKELAAAGGPQVDHVNVAVDKDLSPSAEAAVQGKISDIAIPVVLVDDVLNTGYTMTHAAIPFFRKGHKRISILVLADRTHRKFPIHADMVGISLSTTLQEHLNFEVNGKEMSLYLS